MAKRPEKNSERVEVRLPYSLKQRFLRACERAGETPSEALRDAMADYILRIEQAGKPTQWETLTMKLIHNPLKAAGMTLASLAAFALMAAPSSADERLFASYDSNRDGQITDTEIETEVILALDTDQSNSIQLEEFVPISQRETITDKLTLTDAGNQEREIAVLIRVIDLSQPGKADLTDWGIASPIPIDLSDSEAIDLAQGLLKAMKAHSEGVPHGELGVPQQLIEVLRP